MVRVRRLQDWAGPGNQIVLACIGAIHRDTQALVRTKCYSSCRHHRASAIADDLAHRAHDSDA